MNAHVFETTMNAEKRSMMKVNLNEDNALNARPELQIPRR